MNLKIKSVWIVVILAVLLILCAIYPKPLFILGATLVMAFLVGFQAFTILKENPNKGSDGNYKLP